MQEMFVFKVAVDMTQGSAVVLLADEPVQHLLPIYIGLFEAKAILEELQGKTRERPFTHDLLATVIRELGYQVERITVSALRDTTFYALITLVHNDEVIEIDARPSDSIALALRSGARIFVAEEVLAQAGIQPSEEGLEDELARFEKLMSKLDLDLSGGGEAAPPPAEKEEPPPPEDEGEEEPNI